VSTVFRGYDAFKPLPYRNGHEAPFGLRVARTLKRRLRPANGRSIGEGEGCFIGQSGHLRIQAELESSNVRFRNFRCFYGLRKGRLTNAHARSVVAKRTDYKGAVV
jgi:hypothetical protein